jgi:hypothetical protein
MKYRIIFRNNSGSFAVDAIASTVGGTWSNAVERFDGESDLAFIEVDDENSSYLEEILEEDDNVLSFGER